MYWHPKQLLPDHPRKGRAMPSKRFLLILCSILFLLPLLGCNPTAQYSGTKYDVLVVLVKLSKEPKCPTPESCEPWWPPDQLANIQTPRYKASVYASILNQKVNAYYQKATYGQVYFDFHALVNPESEDGWFEAPGAVWEYNQGRNLYEDGARVAYGAIGDGLKNYHHFLVNQHDRDRSGQTCCTHNGVPYYAFPVNYAFDGKTFPLIGSWVSEGVDDYNLITLVSHELGHQLGAPDQYQDGTGDFTGMGPYDLMGYDTWFNHFGAWTKLNRNWISWAGNTTSMPCLTGDCEITTTLNPLEHPGNNALLIPWFDHTEFVGTMAECRMPINGDENIPESGVLLTTINPYLEDFQYAISQVVSPTNNFLTAMLKPGETYYDEPRRIRVTNLSMPGDEACKVKAERVHSAVPAPDLRIVRAPDEQDASGVLFRSPDIWNDISMNGSQKYPATQTVEWVHAVNGDFAIPEGTGDPIWWDESNFTYFRIQNVGFAAADNITVKVFVRQPMTFSAHNPNCGASPGMLTAQLEALPKLIYQHTVDHLEPMENFVAYARWVPESASPARIDVVIEAVPGEINTFNNSASETLTGFVYSAISADNQPAEIGNVQVNLPQECRWGVPFMVAPMKAEAEQPGAPWEFFAEPAYGFIQPGETASVSVRATPPKDARPGDCATASIGVLFPINDVMASVGGFSFDICVARSSEITINGPGGITPLGSPAAVTGMLTPHRSETIALVYTDPSGEATVTNMNTGPDGAYTDGFVPTVAGTWQAQAFWQGNSEYAPAQSPVIQFTVEEKKPPIFTLANNANCRGGPGTEYDVKCVLYAGTEVEILGRNDDGTWYFVRTADGIECWVSGVSGSALGDLSGVPVLVAPPKPTPTPTEISASACSTYTTLETCQGHGCTWSDGSCH
jgi:M6 family metalloprotease-like protein